jgi:hypothetical protein
MNEVLKDAYKQYSEVGFILQHSAKNQKHAYREGGYKDRKNEPWKDNATGYVGIIPPNLIIVDNDCYKDEGKSFKKLLKDLNLSYTPEPFALTPSGGEHYAFNNPHEDLIVGNLSEKYPALDIYGGYQSALPIVGTTVLNRSNQLTTYQWGSFDDEFIVNEFTTSMLEVLSMRQRVDESENEYDDLSISVKENDMSMDEVKSLLKLIPIETYGYDSGYLKVAMALYDRFEGSNEGLLFLQELCKNYHDNHPELNEKKWKNGNFKPSRSITYKTLRSLANEGRVLGIKKKINNARSNEDFKNIIETLVEQPFLNTSSNLDETVREELASEINLSMKKAKKENPTVKVIQSRTILPLIQQVIVSEKPKSTQVYLCQGKYIIQHNDKIIPEVNSQFLVKYLTIFGLSKPEIQSLQENLIAVNDMKEIPDYTISQATEFKVESNEGTRLSSFVVRSNPLINVGDYIHDDKILNDFLTDIWNGKAQDLVRLIALTIKTEEQKLNRLMLVAPSNTGKTEIFSMLKFQKITMRRLLNGLRGDKGIGPAVIEGIRKTGLLLIDETNDALEAEVKDMDKELHVDQFGSGGTQILPLHFTGLTSTHKRATQNNSDELYNRFLQIELTPKEMKYNLMQSEVYLRDTVKYEKVTHSYLLSLFRSTLLSEEGKDELQELQKMYRLPKNNDLDILLYEISQAFIEDTKNIAKDTGLGGILLRNGEYFYKRKSDISSFFDDKLGEIQALDVGKYSELLTNHFVDLKRVSIKIDGKVSNYYKVNLTTYTDDEDLKIANMFEDLEIADL